MAHSAVTSESERERKGNKCVKRAGGKRGPVERDEQRKYTNYVCLLKNDILSQTRDEREKCFASDRDSGEHTQPLLLSHAMNGKRRREGEKTKKKRRM